MVQAVFKNKDMSVRVSGLWQWDYGQILEIIGLDMSANEVHFSMTGCKEAVITQAQILEDGIIHVNIPDKLLETGRDIRAYVYVADADSGKTIRYIYMDVQKRPKPEDYSSQKEKNLLRQIMESLDKKADDIHLDSGWMQLLCGDKPIGTRVRLPSGGGGREIELKNNGTAIQWRYTDSNEWMDLIHLDELKGDPGETPEFEIRNGHLFVIYKN